MTTIELPNPDFAVLARREAIVRDIVTIAGSGAVIADEDGRRAYETDAFTAYKRMPLAVVLPASTEEVSAVLAYCHKEGIKVVPRGAGTSLCGGALPAEDAAGVPSRPGFCHPCAICSRAIRLCRNGGLVERCVSPLSGGS